MKSSTRATDRPKATTTAVEQRPLMALRVSNFDAGHAVLPSRVCVN